MRQPWFKPGEDPTSFVIWRTYNLTRLCDISMTGELLPLADLQQKIRKKLPWLEYHLVSHLFQSTCKQLPVSLKAFERLMLLDYLPNKGLISIFYEILSTLSPLPVFAYQKVWERDFQTTLDFGFWSSIWDLSLYKSQCANIGMAADKLSYRWHLPHSDICWKQCGNAGDFIHCFWSCPKIQLIIGTRPPSTPQFALFSIWDNRDISSKTRDFTALLLSAATTSEARLWKSTAVPTFQDRFSKIWDLYVQDKISASILQAEGLPVIQDYLEKWIPFKQAALSKKTDAPMFAQQPHYDLLAYF